MSTFLRKRRNAAQQQQRRDRETRAINGLRYSLAAAQLVDGNIANKMEKAEVLLFTVNYLKELKEKQRDVNNLFIENNHFRAGSALAAHEVSKMLDTIPNSSQLRYHLLGHSDQGGNKEVAAVPNKEIAGQKKTTSSV